MADWQTLALFLAESFLVVIIVYPIMNWPKMYGTEYKITCGVCLCVCTGFGGRISRKRLEIEIWLQWTTNRKLPMTNRLVT